MRSKQELREQRLWNHLSDARTTITIAEIITVFDENVFTFYPENEYRFPSIRIHIDPKLWKVNTTGLEEHSVFDRNPCYVMIVFDCIRRNHTTDFDKSLMYILELLVAAKRMNFLDDA